MVDLLRMCIYNCSGGHAHYITLNHEIAVLKYSNVYLLWAISLIWHHLPFHESDV
jgi:hypothetical protein